MEHQKYRIHRTKHQWMIWKMAKNPQHHRQRPINVIPLIITAQIGWAMHANRNMSSMQAKKLIRPTIKRPTAMNINCEYSRRISCSIVDLYLKISFRFRRIQRPAIKHAVIWLTGGIVSSMPAQVHSLFFFFFCLFSILVGLNLGQRRPAWLFHIDRLYFLMHNLFFCFRPCSK